ncbi:MAG: diaminopimelate epimerase [Candidatus Caenarcaniphilales bacterium]|nr:diaminopimelate epimerase [Candidatus Caenarcaniphilales bacterium]
MSVYILPFEKMHGLGNDFILMHNKYLPPKITEQELAKRLCDRHFGVGADGLIVVHPPSEGGDLAWNYINSDGSLGEMCGNGMRCFAKFVFDRNLVPKNEFANSFKVETLAGIIEPTVLEGGQVKVNMGAPILDAASIPVKLTAETPIIDHPIQILDKNFTFTPVSMGNPHSIVFLSSQAELDNFELTKYGPVVEAHQYFPQKINAEFAFVRSRNYIDLKVWERGCGITLACGTGACATVVAANLKGLVGDGPVTVKLPGGELVIEWDKTQNIVWMTGPAQTVFIGQIELDI